MWVNDLLFNTSFRKTAQFVSLFILLADADPRLSNLSRRQKKSQNRHQSTSAADSFDFLILRTLFWWNEFTILAGCSWTVRVYRSWINQLDFWFMFLLQTKFLSRIQMNVIRAHIHQSNYSICDWTSKAKNVLNLKTYFRFSMVDFLREIFLTSNDDGNVQNE